MAHWCQLSNFPDIDAFIGGGGLNPDGSEMDGYEAVMVVVNKHGGMGPFSVELDEMPEVERDAILGRLAGMLGMSFEDAHECLYNEPVQEYRYKLELDEYHAKAGLALREGHAELKAARAAREG